MIWLKIFASLVFWFVYYFIMVLIAAMAGGSPNSDADKALKISIMLSFVPLGVFYVYRLFKTYAMSNGPVFNLSDIYWVILPSVAVAVLVYLSK